MKTIGEFVGYSENCINDAIKNAMDQAGEQQRLVVVETLGESNHRLEKSQYKVTLKAIAE